MKTMDERQEQIRGKIATHSIVFMLVLLLGIAFLDSFDIINFLDYVDLGDLMIILGTILVTFLSLNLIWRDAYFGLMGITQVKGVFFLFFALSIIEDALFIYDLTQSDILIHSIFSIIMVNSIAISLWCKRKDWD